jgi:hypothetical protein
MTREPLFGKNIHPLSVHALGVLRRLRDTGPEPRQEINAGVVRRFLCEELVTIEDRPSPYRTRPGCVEFVVVTSQGLEALSRGNPL